MKALAQAIYAYSQVASPFKTAIDGRVYHVKAEQDAAFPHVVFFFVSNVEESYFTAPADGTMAMHYINFQFNIYSKNNSTLEILDIQEKLEDRFNWADLTPTGFKTTKCEKVNNIGPVWIEELKSFVYSIEYRVKMQRSA